MIPETLLEELHKLNRTDKLRVIQMLAGDLANNEQQYFVPGASYEVWSPYDASEAAMILTKMLEKDKSNND